MTPVFQTNFSIETGNCLEACVASMLNCPLEDVTYFGDYAFKDISDFLEPFGLYCLVIDVLDKEALIFYEGYYILVGRSCSACNHAVIYKAGKLVHDPHSRNSGLEGPILGEDYYQAYFFVQREIK